MASLLFNPSVMATLMENEPIMATAEDLSVANHDLSAFGKYLTEKDNGKPLDFGTWFAGAEGLRMIESHTVGEKKIHSLNVNQVALLHMLLSGYDPPEEKDLERLGVLKLVYLKNGMIVVHHEKLVPQDAKFAVTLDQLNEWKTTLAELTKKKKSFVVGVTDGPHSELITLSKKERKDKGSPTLHKIKNNEKAGLAAFAENISNNITGHHKFLERGEKPTLLEQEMVGTPKRFSAGSVGTSNRSSAEIVGTPTGSSADPLSPKAGGAKRFSRLSNTSN